MNLINSIVIQGELIYCEKNQDGVFFKLKNQNGIFNCFYKDVSYYKTFLKKVNKFYVRSVGKIINDDDNNNNVYIFIEYLEFIKLKNND